MHYYMFLILVPDVEALKIIQVMVQYIYLVVVSHIQQDLFCHFEDIS